MKELLKLTNIASATEAAGGIKLLTDEPESEHG